VLAARSPRRRVALAAALAALALAGGPPWAARPAAHELERTRVALAFAADGGFTLDVENDPAWLLLRLEPFLGDYPDLVLAPRPDRPTPADRDARLAAMTAVFADRLVLFVDGREVRASEVSYHPPVAEADARGTPLPARFRLRGRVPPDARQLRWFYGIVADPYPLTVARADGQVRVEWIGGTVWSAPIDLTGQFVQPTRAEVLAQYLALGYTHILPKGLDHILFVLGLFLLGTGLRALLWQVTAFTVAHSLTLGLSIYGVVALPSRVVEPLIAASIAYVAIENLVTRELHAWRLALVFLFGLLHGLGFAGVLQELGLPRSAFLTALLGFNAGVELGQISVIAAAALVTAPAVRWPGYRRWIVLPACLAIAAMGLWWTVTRVWGG
jgi:hypothetical protein